MPIQFSCTACKKRFKAADKLAGKTVACPGCKVPVKIPGGGPTPVPSPAKDSQKPATEQDIDSLVASALEEPRKETKVSATIDFQCPFCEEKLSVSADLGGKQSPCTSCRRIVKVPLPEKKEGPDWKKEGPKRPLGALRPQEPELEGTWNSSMDSVSRDALLEAGAIVEEKIPLTRGQKITRIAIAVFGVLFLYFAYSTIQGLRSKSQFDFQLGKIEGGIKSGDLANIPGESKGVLLGDVALLKYLVVKEPDPAKSKKGFQAALAALDTKPGSRLDKDLALIELSRGIISLGGNKEEERDKLKLKWDDVQKFLKQPLDGFSLEEMKLIALDEACRHFIAKGETARAIAFSSQVMSGTAAASDKRFDSTSEVEAVLGLELLNAQKSEELKPVLERIRARYSQGANQPLSPATAVLFTIAEKDKPLPFSLPKVPTNEQELICMLAIDLGNGVLDETLASQKYTGLEPITRIRALGKIGFLAAVMGKVTPKLTEEIKKILDEAIMPTQDIIQSYLLLAGIADQVGAPAESWLKAGEKVPANHAEVKSIRARFQLAALQAKKELTLASVEEASKIESGTLSRFLAFRSLGIRGQNFAATLEPAISKLSDPDKSFGFVGLAIGFSSKPKK